MAFTYDSYNYPQYWHGREYEDQSEKIALDKLISLIPQKDYLVDIGGGFGRLFPVYAKNFKKCLLIDPSKKLLQQAKINLKSKKNIKLKIGRAQKIPVASNICDVALMIRVSHHLSKIFPALQEAYRILKPNGYLIIEFPNKIHLKSALKALVQNNFYFLTSHEPINLSSKDNVPFINYHPSHIRSALLSNHFKIIQSLSVSNFRNPTFKKLIPLKILLSLESTLQPVLASFNFGPSIFILAQKKP